MERPVELKAPGWIKCVGDLETIVEITLRLAHIYDTDGIEVQDSRTLIWVAEDLHDMFLRIHASKDKDYWEDRCYLEALNELMDKFFSCLQKEPDWINTKHRSMYGEETAEDLINRHGGFTDDDKASPTTG